MVELFLSTVADLHNKRYIQNFPDVKKNICHAEGYM